MGSFAVYAQTKILNPDEVEAAMQANKAEYDLAKIQLQESLDAIKNVPQLPTEKPFLVRPPKKLDEIKIEKPDLNVDMPNIPLPEIPIPPKPTDVRDRGINSCQLKNWEKQAYFNCGECETDLQDGLNDIINGITEQDLKTYHWGDILDNEKIDSENLKMKPDANFDDTLASILWPQSPQNL